MPTSSGKKPAKYMIASADSSITFGLDAREEGLEPILASAYLMTDRAYALLEGDRAKKISVTLRGKKPLSAKELKDLADTFLAELATQKVRWAIAKNNLPVREFVAEQAVLLANGKLPPPAQEPPAADQLTGDQKKEIEKLIAEVEAEIRDMNQKKAVPDPKNIKASWEEKQETKG